MQPTHIIFRILFQTISVVGWVSFVVCLVMHMKSLRESSVLDIPVILAMYAVIVWLTIIVHELGHAVVAWLLGFRIEAIVLGPVKLVRIDGRLRWRFNVQSFAPGYVLATPIHPRNLMKRYALFTLGGPAFTLLLILVSFLLSASFMEDFAGSDVINGMRFKNQGLVHYYFAVIFCLLVNINTFFVCMIPYVLPGGHPNDGGILLWLRKQSFTLRDFEISRLYHQMNEGIRPSQLNRDELLRCVGAMQSGTANDLPVFLMGYYHFLDAGTFSAAEVMLEKAMVVQKEYPAEVRPSVLLESVYFQAMFHGKVKGAWEIIGQCQEKDVEKPTMLRAKAAVLLVEGKRSEAVATVHQALGLLKSAKDKGGALAEADWLEEIIRRCSLGNEPTSLPGGESAGKR